MKISPILARWLAIIWTIIMLIGCLTPHDDLPEELLSWSDKLLHVLIFAPFTLLWALAGFPMGRVLIAGILFGALIEVLQYILPINRSGDLIDLLADSLGAVVGIGIAWLIPQKYRFV
ncbi:MULTISPECIES: VanZ family protein [unclassified Spirosoma]|uniref:VanZ family protein n=1 Tax=unclassified Spirosoma TaxID=2621999 RepID=UPI00095F0FE1|nr:MULTISPECIES: VanZ family protein [unclassified Spirosoma]MBN8824232.1 VanZ family protein [Spirosoma sp.]OJW78964.1 MAG: hypothetical protein BGO59_10905 [Spirosoma sp. 48-14]